MHTYKYCLHFYYKTTYMHICLNLYCNTAFIQTSKWGIAFNIIMPLCIHENTAYAFAKTLAICIPTNTADMFTTILPKCIYAYISTVIMP